MKSSRILATSIATFFAASAINTVSQAADGTWNVDANGNWSLATNWLNSAIADGADSTANFRFNITATRTVTLDTAARTIGNLVFEDATTASNDWVLSSATATNVLTLDTSAGTPTISILNRTATINTILGGTKGIKVLSNTTGTVGGTLVLTAANTFTGGLNITGGIVQLNNALAAGSNTITVDNAANSGIANKLTINGGVTIANPIIINGAGPLAGNGAVQQVGTGLATVNGAITINNGTANGGHFVGGAAVGNELVLGGPITASVGVVQREGRVIYKGGGSYSSLTVTNTAIVGANDGLSTSANVVLGGSGNATLDLNGFNQALSGLTLGNSGAANSFVGSITLGAKTLTLNGNISSVSNAAQNVTHVMNATAGGILDVGTSSRSINLTDTLAYDDMVINGGVITGTGGIIKTGAGALTLNGVTVAGPLLVNSGTLAVGRGSDVSTLTTQSLAFDAGVSALRLKIGATGDLINTGALTTAGLTTINLIQNGGIVPNGTYNLIKYTGTSPGLSGFTLAPIGHATATLVNTGSTIAVNITGNSRVVWDGTSGPSWDLFSTNWKLQTTNAPTSYIESDDVIFADNPISSSVDIATNVTPSNVTFTNSSGTTYTVTGAGGIVGPTGLTKTGNGTVILRAQNTYTGATAISGGTVELDHDATGNQVLTATSGVSVAAGATLKLTRDDGDITFTPKLSGAGTVVVDPHSAAGTAVRTVILNGDNSGFSGQWKFTSSAGAGTGGGSYRTNPQLTAANLGTAAVQVDSGAQVWLATNQTFTNNFVVSGAGFSETAGNTAIGPVTTTTSGVYLGTGTPLFSYGGIGALRIDTGAVFTGSFQTNGNAKLGAHNATATFAGNITSANPTDWLVLGGGSGSHTFIVTGNANPAQLLVNGGSGTSGVTQTLQIGNNGTTGSVSTPEIVLWGDSAGVGALRFSRSDGYTLAPTQKITAAASATANLGRARFLVNTTGTGLTLNGATVDLSDGTSGGQVQVAGNDNTNGVAGAILNINAASVVDTGNFFVGDANGFSGTVNQSGTSTTTFLGQMRIGHWPNETATYNLSGGTLTAAGVPTQFPFQTAGTQETNGGVYLGIDGAGILNQTNGTVATNFIVLDNRADTGGGLNMPTGVDTYTLTNGTLVLKNAFGIISRNASTAVNLNGGIIQASTGVSPNLDSNKITVGGPVTLDTNGANTFALYGPLAGTGTVSVIGGGFLRTLDGTGTTLTQAGGGMPGGSLGTASLNIGATNTLQANRTGVDVWSGALLGTGAFVKQNTGSLFITGAGTGFLGTTTVSAGRLDVPNNFASPSITVADGAALGGEPTTATVTLGATTGSTLFINGTTAGALTAGSLTLNGVTTIDFSAPPTASGPITVLNYTTKTGTGFALANAANYRVASITDTGGGTVTLNITTKNLAWTGATSAAWDVNTTANWNDGAAADKFFAGDTVTFGDSSAVSAVSVASGVSPWKTTVNSDTTNYTLTATGSGIAGPGNLEKSGLSTLTLSGTNTYSGQTILNGGNLTIAAPASLGNGGATNTITFNGGKLTASATLDLGALRTIAVGAGGGTLSSSGAAALTITASGGLTGSGPLTLTSGATVAPTFVLSGNNSGFTGTINVDSTGATSGGTTLRFSNSLPISGGTINLAAATVTGAATGIDLVNVTLPNAVSLVMNTSAAGGSSFRSQVVNTAGFGAINGPIALNGDAIAQFSPAGFLTLNGNVAAGASGFTGTMFLRGAGQGAVNGTINLPNGTVSKTDAGTWTINSTGGSWTNTSVAVGTLAMGAANVLPATTNLLLGQNDTSTAALNLNGFSQTVASLASNPTTVGANTTGKSITSATPATLTVNQATDTTYASLITGSTALVKDGAGSLTLSGASTFTGNVTVNGGTLVTGGATVTGLGSATTAGRTVTVNNGSTLSFTTNNVFGNGVNNSNLPSVTLNNSTLTSTRYNVLGNLTLNGGMLTQAATDSGNYEGFQFRGNVFVTGTTASTIGTTNGKANHLAASTTFDVADVTGSAATDLVVSAPFRDQSGDFGSATGGLAKIGAGTMELTAVNTYTGSTAINAGTLLVSGSLVGSTTVNTGGTLGGSGTVGPVNAIGGSVAPGAGIGTLTTGDFSLNSSSLLKFELAQPGTVGGGINDLISVLGGLTLDGTLQVTELSGFSTGTYRLFNYTGSLVNNTLDLQPAFLLAHGGSRIDTSTIGQVNLVVVPEPAALVSLLGGAGMLAGLQRFRRRNRA